MRRDERGSVVVTAVLVGLVLAMLGGSLLRGSFADLRQTERAGATSRAFQAAEAGVNDYIAKLTEDRRYYDHVVHPAEATRAPDHETIEDGVRVWNGDLTWTYASQDHWSALGDGTEYGLQIEPPRAGRLTIRIVATGRVVGEPATTRSVEAFVRAASIADFQMIANANIRYGSGAETFGKIYAGNGGNVTHEGVAHADIHAEGQVYGPSGGSPTLVAPAAAYDSDSTPTIRSVIPTPIDFSRFTRSIGDLKQAAESNKGIVLDDPTYAAWWLTFNADGTITVRGCPTVDLSASAPVGVPPTCETPAGYPVPVQVPTNGAVYAAQNAIVSGSVKGRVTVATIERIVVGGNIAYVTPGTDVLGLIGDRGLIVPRWAPHDLTWSAATLAVNGKWEGAWVSGNPPTHGNFVFRGSIATFLGGGMNLFSNRTYDYDENLYFLQPPYFPVLEDAYTVELFREIPTP